MTTIAPRTAAARTAAASADRLVPTRTAATAGRATPVRRTPRLPHRGASAAALSSADASRLARVAVTDWRSQQDRVLDRVAEGLLAELGW